MKKKKSDLLEQKFFKMLKDPNFSHIDLLAWIWFFKMKETLFTLLIAAIIALVFMTKMVWERDDSGSLRIKTIELPGMEIDK